MAGNFGPYIQRFNQGFWDIIYAPIDSFTKYWAGLEYKQKLEESQLVPSGEANRNKFHFNVPHPPIQIFSESTFGFNLNGPLKKLGTRKPMITLMTLL